jgi:hypothetical protein
MRPLDDAPNTDELLPDLLADTRARTGRAEVTDTLDAIDGALTNNIRPLTGAAMKEDLYQCPQCSAPPAPWTDGTVKAEGDERDEFWCQTCGWETPLDECLRYPAESA